MGVVLIKDKKKNVLPIILLGVILIPIVCNATGLIELKVNSKVDFDYANDKFCFKNKMFSYRDGMTFDDFFTSNYFDANTDGDTFKCFPERPGQDYFWNCETYLDGDFVAEDSEDTRNILIKNVDNGCYYLGILSL